MTPTIYHNREGYYAVSEDGEVSEYYQTKSGCAAAVEDGSAWSEVAVSHDSPSSNRTFYVVVPGPTGDMHYPAMEGEPALALMERLIARGVSAEKMAAHTSANGIEESLSVDEMREIYSDEQPELFALVAEPATRPKRATFCSAKTTQRVLLTGLGCKPGQADLFEVDGTA